jgi:hypothetical protein
LRGRDGAGRRLDEREHSGYRHDNTGDHENEHHCAHDHHHDRDDDSHVSTTMECNTAARVRSEGGVREDGDNENQSGGPSSFLLRETQCEAVGFHPLPHTPLHLRA